MRGLLQTCHGQGTGPSRPQRTSGLLILSQTQERRRLTGESFISDDFGSKRKDGRFGDGL